MHSLGFVFSFCSFCFCFHTLWCAHSVCFSFAASAFVPYSLMRSLCVFFFCSVCFCPILSDALTLFVPSAAVLSCAIWFSAVLSCYIWVLVLFVLCGAALLRHSLCLCHCVWYPGTLSCFPILYCTPLPFQDFVLGSLNLSHTICMCTPLVSSGWVFPFRCPILRHGICCHTPLSRVPLALQGRYFLFTSLFLFCCQWCSDTLLCFLITLAPLLCSLWFCTDSVGPESSRILLCNYNAFCKEVFGVHVLTWHHLFARGTSNTL